VIAVAALRVAGDVRDDDDDAAAAAVDAADRAVLPVSGAPALLVVSTPLRGGRLTLDLSYERMSVRGHAA
jgi:hypothetical protein